MKRVAIALSIALAVSVPLVAAAAAPLARTLRVFAAASLGEAFGDIAREFERAHPGTRVELNLAGSQLLAAQLAQGARADVFASADARWMDSVAVRFGLLDPAREFARNRLVVIVPRTNPARIGRLEDLARPGVKLVIGAEAVPVGQYSREMLRRLGSSPGFPRNFMAHVLRNVVSEEENVRAVVGKVRLGEADAGICYRSDAAGAAARFVRVFDLPDEHNPIASYPIAALAAAANPDGARAFVAAVLAPAGQALLARHALIPAAGAP